MIGLPELGRRTLLATFERALAHRPDDLAQVDAAGHWTFTKSYQRSLRLGAGFRRLGLDRGAPVALVLDNSLDAVHAWTALGLQGMVEVPVNTAYVGRFLTHVLNDSGAQMAVVEDRYLERIAAVADDLTSLRTLVVRGSAEPSPALRRRFRIVPLADLDDGTSASPVRSDAGDVHAIMYTSGTTGVSKGVLITQAHAYTYASREDEVRPRPDDRILVVLPVFHLAGQWYGVYQALIHQARCVLEPSFSVSRFWGLVRDHGITVTVMLGAMAELLQQRPPAADDADNPLELAVMAPLASDVSRFRDRFGVALAAVYGMSEVGAVLSGPPETVVGGEAGFPRVGYDLRLVDPEGTDVAANEIGELWVRPTHRETVMVGYHNLPEKTAETISDGWVHTGDAFRRDDKGRFFFADRMKDALRRRGENVSSFEVERVVNEFPSVFESAVVAVPSNLSEDEIKVVVVPRPDEQVDPAELTQFLVERLPYFMVPRYVQLTDELPRTPTHKVIKHLLREAPGSDVWDREAAGIVLRRPQ